jgi:tRNA-dihydrouridine synthase
MIDYHYELLKKNTSDKKALLDIKTHALAYLKLIPGSKEYKNKIAVSKTEEEFKNCLEELKKIA